MRLWHIISAMIFVTCVTWAAAIWLGQMAEKAQAKYTAVEQALGECSPASEADKGGIR